MLSHSFLLIFVSVNFFLFLLPFVDRLIFVCFVSLLYSDRILSLFIYFHLSIIFFVYNVCVTNCLQLIALEAWEKIFTFS